MTGLYAQIVCHSFLQRRSPKEREELLKLLPEEDAIALATLEESELPIPSPPPSFVATLDQIHPSWLAPFLRKLPASEIPLFLHALCPSQVSELKEKLLFSSPLPSLSSLGRDFLRDTLAASLQAEEVLPYEALPKHPLNALYALSHSKLLSLIDLLSMHDLATEISHIIDTVKLKKIYTILTKPQNTYLRALSTKKEPVAFKPLGLSTWDGNQEALRSLLKQRGLNRLGKALCLCHPSLLFHVSHHLDVELGLRLQELSTPLGHPQAALLLSKQILEILRAQDEE